MRFWKCFLFAALMGLVISGTSCSRSGAAVGEGAGPDKHQSQTSTGHESGIVDLRNSSDAGSVGNEADHSTAKVGLDTDADVFGLPASCVDLVEVMSTIVSIGVEEALADADGHLWLTGDDVAVNDLWMKIPPEIRSDFLRWSDALIAYGQLIHGIDGRPVGNDSSAFVDPTIVAAELLDDPETVAAQARIAAYLNETCTPS